VIYAYAEQPSPRPGDPCTLRVSTDAAAFRIEFSRCGADLEPRGGSDWWPGVDAPAHLPGQDWGSSGLGLTGEPLAAWPAYRWTVPSDWTSGVYLLALVEGDGAGRDLAPVDVRTTPDARGGTALVVVRSAQPAAPLLYKVPLLTYQAYNLAGPDPYDAGTGQGGWCLYTEPDELPEHVLRGVSLHRPGAGTGGTPWDTHNWDPYDAVSPRQSFAHWDARFIAWLEREGRAVDYCTDVDLHSDGEQLLAPYPLLVSAGHDEYWTDAMRSAVEQYVDRGGNVAFFGGNTCWWRVELDDGVRFRRTQQWWQTGRPENDLTGVSFRNGGERDREEHPVPVGYRVQHADHWAYAGTGLRDGDVFGAHEHLVGYECDGAAFDRSLGEPVAASGEDGTPAGFVVLGVGDCRPSGWGNGNSAATMGVHERGIQGAGVTGTGVTGAGVRGAGVRGAGVRGAGVVGAGVVGAGVVGTVFNCATTDWARVLDGGQCPPLEQITRNVLDRLGAAAGTEPVRDVGALGHSHPVTARPASEGASMSEHLDVVVLPGSARGAAPGLEPAGELDPSQEVGLTVVLRRRGELPGQNRSVLQRDELADIAGADPADLAVVVQVLTGLGLQILSSDAAQRTVRVAGPLGRVSEVFATPLQRVRSQHPGSGAAVEHRHRTGELHIPAELAGIVVAVLGLDDRPQSRAHYRAATAPQVSYTGAQLGTVYNFPPGTDGAGQTLSIIELGGGYSDADLQHYFTGLGLPVPAVRAVGVDGAVNVPGKDPQGADGEVLLDIEVAGALAPAAALVVYFAPNTDAGFLDAVNTAAHATPAPTAMSISWGQSEDAWTAQARHALDAAMADAAALGVTVTVAAGDDGSSDRATDGRAHVDFPAASPHALACGGTALHADPATGAVTSETVWDDPGHGATGGGVSHDFPQPVWQAAVGVPLRAGHPRSRKGRGVPDVAGDADPATGYGVYVDGKAQVFGGTSAVAPLWAALVCRLAQALGRPLGLLQPALYSGAQAGQPTPGLRDITSGSNGAYTAGPGWDACTGLGVPDGAALLEQLR